jgi:hypothetical protein
VHKDTLDQAIFKDDINFSTMWEVWDKRSMEVFLVAENHFRYLKLPSNWPKYQDEFPFSHLYFNRVPDKPFPIPDIAPFEPQILEEIKMIAMALNHVKRWNRMAFVKRGALRRSEMDKYERGVDGSIIEVDAGAPADVVKTTDYPSLQGDVYAILARLADIRTRVSGQPAAAQGGSDRASTRTLGQLELQAAGGQNRVSRKQDRVETHIETIARHMIGHMKRSFDVPQIMKITGMPPEEIVKSFGENFDPITGTLKFTKNDIVGEYDVEVKAGSTLPLNKENRLAILNGVLEQVAKLGGIENLPPFIKTIVAEILRDLDIKALEVAFAKGEIRSKQAQEAKAKAAQIELAKVKAEGDKRAAQAAQVRSETNMNKATTLGDAAEKGTLPEVIETARGLGELPSDEDVQ